MQFPEGEVQHVVRFESTPWQPCLPTLPPGCEMAVLDGSPQTEDLFTVRFRVSDTFVMPPHWHPKDERVTIISGTAAVAFGADSSRQEATEFGPGDYYVNARHAVHTVWIEGPTVLQITGIGPWKAVPVEEGSPQNTAWSIKASYTDTCSCAPTCPCFFGSAPTLGHCEGITLVEIESGHYEDVRLDGVKVLAVYRGGEWMKFYVNDEASEEQTEAAVKLLPAFEDFFVSDNVLEVKNVPITVERSAERMKISTPNTTAEIEIMKGKNGKPIKIENLPSPGFQTLPMLDHTQYRSVVLKHEAEDKQFEYSGTTGFTARIEAVAPEGN